MTNQSQKGEELNQLSRILFDKASRLGWMGLGLECGGALLGVIGGYTFVEHESQVVNAIVVFLLFLIGYALRIHSSDIYDSAETMRRQSVFSEALGWQIPRTQFSIWREKAGKRVLSVFEREPRDPDYYSTTQEPGPRRLLEMTDESNFYTWHLYSKIHLWTGLLAFVVIVIWVGTLTILPFPVGCRTQKRRFIYPAC